MSRSPHRRSARCARRVEQLEPRVVLDAAPLGADAYLTLSFVDDGTDVAGRPSTLQAAYDSLGTRDAWQETILRAFQTWAIHTNSDIGVVGDSGDPLGTPGGTRGDDRFGDIRIAAVELEPEIGAVSVPIDDVLAGTWHADVLFNTAFPYESLDDLFAIALHEAGNVYGLIDNHDPNSPLMAGPIPTAVVPTAGDIADLQALHGARAVDVNERVEEGDDEVGDGPNDTRAFATDLDPEAEPGVGVFPGLAYGDIQTNSDVDYFRLEVPLEYAGPVTVTMRTAGVSLLVPRLALESAAGASLGSATGAGVRGDTVSLTIPEASPGEVYYLRAEAGVPGLYGVGGYALSAVFDAANPVSVEELDRVTDGSFRGLETDDLTELLDPDSDGINGDLGTNDSLIDATPLQGAAGFAAASRFETMASVSYVGDQDYYQIEDSGELTAGRAIVTLRSLDRGGLIPAVHAFNEAGEAFDTTVLVNGAGEYVAEVDTTSGFRELILRVAASDSAGPFTTGNYSLAVGFASQPRVLSTFVSGVAGDLTTVDTHDLSVAEPQLFHFALEADGAPDTASAVAATIRDENGLAVHSITALRGETRSAGAVLLPIGAYTVEVSALSLNQELGAPISYRLLGDPFSDPFVGDGSDPTSNPFACQGDLDGFYCYPAGIVSSDPFLWNDFTASSQQDLAQVDTSQEIQQLLGDWWTWVWATLGVNGPPLAMSDDFTTDGAPPTNGQFARATAPLNVLDNDVEPEGDPVVAVLTRDPAHGSVVLRPDGTFEYTPNPGFVGFDSFRYAAYDFGNESESATAWVTVNGSHALAGDYNGDGVVDQGDADFWRANYGELGGPADGNGDGFVNAADYTIYRDNLGATAPPAPAAEPHRAPSSEVAFALSAPLPPAPAPTSPAIAAGDANPIQEEGFALQKQGRLLLLQPARATPRDEAFATFSAADSETPSIRGERPAYRSGWRSLREPI